MGHGWGTGRGIPGTNPASPRLRLIPVNLRLIGSYGRLTENYVKYLRSEISGIWPWILTLDLTWDLALDLDPGSDPDWL